MKESTKPGWSCAEHGFYTVIPKEWAKHIQGHMIDVAFRAGASEVKAALRLPGFKIREAAPE